MHSTRANQLKIRRRAYFISSQLRFSQESLQLNVKREEKSETIKNIFLKYKHLHSPSKPIQFIREQNRRINLLNNPLQYTGG